MIKLKDTNCDETKKLLWWNLKTKKKLWNSKAQIGIKLKILNCEKNQKLKLWQKSKTPIVTKFKLWLNSTCDKTKKNIKCNKTKIVTKLKNSNRDKTLKLKSWQNSKTQTVTKLELWIISIYIAEIFLKESFSMNILTRWQPMRYSLGSVLQFLQCFILLFALFLFMSYITVRYKAPKG